MKENGHQTPAVKLFWDQESQVVRYELDQTQVKNLDSAVSLMEMALSLLKFNQTMFRGQIAQQKMQEEAVRQQQAQMQAAHLQGKILRG